MCARACPVRPATATNNIRLAPRLPFNATRAHAPKMRTGPPPPTPSPPPPARVRSSEPRLGSTAPPRRGGPVYAVVADSVSRLPRYGGRNRAVNRLCARRHVTALKNSVLVRTLLRPLHAAVRFVYARRPLNKPNWMCFRFNVRRPPDRRDDITFWRTHSDRVIWLRAFGESDLNWLSRCTFTYILSRLDEEICEMYEFFFNAWFCVTKKITPTPTRSITIGVLKTKRY